MIDGPVSLARPVGLTLPVHVGLVVPVGETIDAMMTVAVSETVPVCTNVPVHRRLAEASLFPADEDSREGFRPRNFQIASLLDGIGF